MKHATMRPNQSISQVDNSEYSGNYPGKQFRLFGFLILMLCILPILGKAETLPDPQNIGISGSTLSWDSVPGAAGYNLYIGDIESFENNWCPMRYYNTVGDVTQTELDQTGLYYVVAFDETGTNFSAINFICDSKIIFDLEGDESSVVIQYSYKSTLVTKTCKNVNPGGSCVAACSPTSVNLELVSGGACTTSDIVEADSTMSFDSYTCTVPTFSGEVVAQAMCVDR